MDWQDPEAAIFTCQVQSAMQQDGMHVQQDHALPGVAQGLPGGWTLAIDPASGATYYFNEQTGQNQWETPQQQGGC